MCGPIVLLNWSVTLIAQLVPFYGLHSSTRPGTSLHASDQAVKVGWAGEGSGCERVVLAANRETRVWQTKIRLTLGCLKPQ